jgi:hypothetical protein
MILAKTAALCLVAGALMLVAVLTLMALQTAVASTTSSWAVSAIGVHLQRYLLLCCASWPWSFRRFAKQMAGAAADAGRLHRPAEPGTDGLRPSCCTTSASPMPSTPTWTASATSPNRCSR